MTEADYAEWLQHPVTEWVFAQVDKFGAQQQARWSELAWSTGELDPAIFAEARVRADCYKALSQSSFEDWKQIDDTGN